MLAEWLREKWTHRQDRFRIISREIDVENQGVLVAETYGSRVQLSVTEGHQTRNMHKQSPVPPASPLPGLFPNLSPQLSLHSQPVLPPSLSSLCLRVPSRPPPHPQPARDPIPDWSVPPICFQSSSSASQHQSLAHHEHSPTV